MTGSPLFLGVDGGGTKTEFVCTDAENRVVARARTGTTYHLEVGLDRAIARLEEGVTAICAETGSPPDSFAFVFFGLPAFGEDSRIDPLIASACGRILGHDRYVCDNDMVCGWAGSLACADGINLVAGTGSIAYGRRRGVSARAGGWGELIGDEGSAYWIALHGLDAFARMSDGRLPPGSLHALVGERLALSHDLELCERVMGDDAIGREQIAALAPLVAEAARRGDAAAGAILEQAAAELAGLAIAIRTRLGYAADERAQISWSGGVLDNVEEVRSAFIAGLHRAGSFELIEPRLSPALGAALYAAKLSPRSASPPSSI